MYGMVLLTPHSHAWLLQDSSRSDSMDGFCQLFGVPRWLRQATRLVNGLELATSGDVLLVKQVSC